MSDCGCVGIHDGQTHGEHMDQLYRRMNLEHLAVLNDVTADPWRRFLAGLAFATEEAARLRLKEAWLRTNKHIEEHH